MMNSRDIAVRVNIQSAWWDDNAPESVLPWKPEPESSPCFHYWKKNTTNIPKPICHVVVSANWRLRDTQLLSEYKSQDQGN